MSIRVASSGAIQKESHCRGWATSNPSSSGIIAVMIHTPTSPPAEDDRQAKCPVPHGHVVYWTKSAYHRAHCFLCEDVLRWIPERTAYPRLVAIQDFRCCFAAQHGRVCSEGHQDAGQKQERLPIALRPEPQRHQFISRQLMVLEPRPSIPCQLRWPSGAGRHHRFEGDCFGRALGHFRSKRHHLPDALFCREASASAASARRALNRWEANSPQTPKPPAPILPQSNII